MSKQKVKKKRGVTGRERSNQTEIIGELNTTAKVLPLVKTFCITTKTALWSKASW